MNRDEYVQAVMASAEKIVKQAVLKRLVSFAPIFATGFLNYVATRIISAVVVAVFETVEMKAFFLYVDMRVDKQGADFAAAALEWYNAAPEEKIKYEKEYLEKFYVVASLTS